MITQARLALAVLASDVACLEPPTASAIKSPSGYHLILFPFPCGVVAEATAVVNTTKRQVAYYEMVLQMARRS